MKPVHFIFFPAFLFAVFCYIFAQNDLGTKLQQRIFLTPFGFLQKPTVRFIGFKEDQVGWFYEEIATDAFKIQVSVYLHTLTLTPIFDINRTLSFTTTHQMQDEKLDQFWRIVHQPDGSSSLVLRVKDYVTNNIKFHEMLINFGLEFEKFTFFFVFDELNYNYNPNDWVRSSRIGNGKYASIRQITHKVYNISCALKNRHPNRGFYNETRILAELRSYETIVDVYGWKVVFGRPPDMKTARKKSNDTSYLLLELMDGDAGHLAKELHTKFHNYELSLSQSQFDAALDNIASKAALSMIQGLQILHAHNYTHYDGKSGNLLYKKIGELEYEWKLSDVESARYLKDPSGEFLKYHKLAGPFSYRPPELLHQQLFPSDGRVDYYAVGLVVFQIFFNRYPFDVPNGTQYDAIDKRSLYKDLDKCPDCFDGVQMSDQAKDFVTNLMRWDVSKRMTLDEALRHSWLKRHTKKENIGHRSNKVSN